MGGQSDRHLASDKERLQKALETLEEKLVRRTLIAHDLAPDEFLDEAAALKLVIELRRELFNRG